MVRSHEEFRIYSLITIIPIVGRYCRKDIYPMSKYEIPFLTAAIHAFGSRFAMTRQDAFRYLHEHKGLEFLIEFYDVEHLQSMDETIDDLLVICQKNGGAIV